VLCLHHCCHSDVCWWLCLALWWLKRTGMALGWRQCGGPAVKAAGWVAALGGNLCWIALHGAIVHNGVVCVFVCDVLTAFA